MKFLLLTMFFLISCSKQNGKAGFELKLLESVPFSSRIDGLYPSVNKDLEIKSPPNTWVDIFQSEVTDENGVGRYHCVFYKVPGKENGILRYVESSSSCLGDYQNDSAVDWTEINFLKVWKPEFERKIFEKVLKPGRLYFTGKAESGDFFLEFPLFNLDLPRKLERHALTLSPKMLRGLYVSKSQDALVKLDKKTFLGDFKDNYRDRSAVVCQEFSKDCKETTAFKCDQCRFGWYSAVGISTCGGQYTRFCGVNECGQRGMPACPRGLDSAKRMGLDDVMLCYDGSPLGYCESGLKTVCDGKVLVCL